MGEWKEIQLKEFVEFKNGYAFKGTDFIESGVPVIKIKNVKPNNILLDNLSYISQKNAEGKENYLIRPKDILITMSGNRSDGSPDSWVGKVALFKKEGTFLLNQRVSIIRVNEKKASVPFVAYNLSSWPTQVYLINQANSSGGQANISPDIVKEMEILLPPLKEQIQIADILSSLDDKIDLLHRQNKTLEQLAETLFRQWFVVEKEVSWEIVRICDVAEINSRTISKNYSFSEIEYLDTGSITDGTIRGFQTYKLDDAPSRAQRIVEDNDIVYSLVRPVQRHYGLLNEVKPNTIVSTGFCVITCPEFSPHFLYILLTTSENVEYFDMIAEGATSTYPSLKPSDIANFEFLKPPQEKLNRFSRIAFDNWDKIKSNTNQIRTLTQLRDTLLPKLMSGHILIDNLISNS